MESANPVNGEEMCIYISCFCEGTVAIRGFFFLFVRGCLENKAGSRRMGR